MTVGPWVVTDEREAFRNRWIDVRIETCRTPSGAVVSDYTVSHFSDWTVAVAITEDGRYVITRQWREGAQDLSLEAAGGVVDAGEDPAQAAVRELLEETGYAGRYHRAILKVRPNPANQRNWFHAHLVVDCRKVVEPLAHETEKLETVLMSRADILGAIADGRMHHALQVATFMTLFHSEGV